MCQHYLVFFHKLSYTWLSQLVVNEVVCLSIGGAPKAWHWIMFQNQQNKYRHNRRKFTHTSYKQWTCMHARVSEPYIKCPYSCPCPPMPMGFGWAWVQYYYSYKVIDLEKNEIITTVSLALPMNWDTTAIFNIFLWWKLKEAPTFPIMSRVARSVLCIPASNSKSESNFTDARNTLTKRQWTTFYLSDPTKIWCRRIIHITQLLNTWENMNSTGGHMQCSGGHRSLLMVMVSVWVQIWRKMLGSEEYSISVLWWVWVHKTTKQQLRMPAWKY